LRMLGPDRPPIRTKMKFPIGMRKTVEKPQTAQGALHCYTNDDFGHARSAPVSGANAASAPGSLSGLPDLPKKSSIYYNDLHMRGDIGDLF
jgi:hypothetical protein